MKNSILAIFTVLLITELPVSAKELNLLKLSTSTASFEFDPTRGVGYQQYVLLSLFCDSLIEISEAGQIVSGIAQSWKSDAGGTSYTFTLNPNAKFHDGRQILASDVAASLSRHFLPTSPSIVKSYLGAALKSEILNSDGILSSITIKSKSEVTIHLRGPYEPFLKILANSAFCIIPADFDSNRPIGSGQFELVNKSPDKTVLLKRSVYARQKSSAFEQISVKFLKEKADILNAFKNDQIDFAMGLPFSEFNDSDILTGTAIQNTKSLSITSVFLNSHTEHFKDREFRHDIAGLFSTMKKDPRFLSKVDEVQTTFLPKGIMLPSYYQRSPYSLPAATFKHKWSKVLASAKSLHLVLPMGFFNEQAQALIRETFSLAGLSLNISILKGMPLAESIKNGDYDMIIIPYAGMYPDPDGFLDLIRPDGLLKASMSKSDGVFFDNMAKSRFILDRTARLQGYEVELRAFEEECYQIPLAQQSLPVLYRTSLDLPDTTFRFHVDLLRVRPR